MNGKQARVARKAAHETALGMAAQLRDPIGAALSNEQVTRGRVDSLERRADAMVRDHDALQVLVADHVNLGLLGRLRWLLRGR